MKRKDLVDGVRITIPLWYGHDKQSQILIVHRIESSKDDVALWDMNGKSLCNVEFNESGTKIRLYDAVAGIVITSRWISLKDVVSHGLSSPALTLEKG